MPRTPAQHQQQPELLIGRQDGFMHSCYLHQILNVAVEIKTHHTKLHFSTLLSEFAEPV